MIWCLTVKLSGSCDVLGSDHTIAILVEISLDDTVVRGEIEFGEIIGDHVAAELWLLTPGNEFYLRCIFYGIDIQHFADSFGCLSVRRTHLARLTDWDGEIQLFFCRRFETRSHLSWWKVRRRNFWYRGLV